MKLASISLLRLFASVAFLCSVLSVQAEDKKADPTGTWAWTFQRPGGGEGRESLLKIKKEGDKYLGTLTTARREGEPRETKIDNIKVEGESINFSITREFNGNSFTQKYSAKVSGDTLTGKIEFTGRDGEVRSRDWMAKRKKDAAKG